MISSDSPSCKGYKLIDNEVNIEFEPENLEYEFSVEYNINELHIKAEPEVKTEE